MEDEAQVVVLAVVCLVDVEQVVTLTVHACLVEDVQDALHVVAHAAVQQWYLHDNAAVREAVHKGVGQTPRHRLALIVLRTGGDVEHRLLYPSYGVAQQVDGNHGQGVLALALGRVATLGGVTHFRAATLGGVTHFRAATLGGVTHYTVGHHVLLSAVLRAKVLAEAQQVAWQVALLQLDEHVLLAPVLVSGHRTVVETEHRHGFALHVDEFVAPRLHMHHLTAQQGGEQDFHHALVLHEVLERKVVDRVGNGRCHDKECF